MRHQIDHLLNRPGAVSQASGHGRRGFDSQNYHQWLSAQYGLKKLLEHIWRLIGIASTCKSLPELKRRMAEIHGKIQMQLTLFVDPPG